MGWFSARQCVNECVLTEGWIMLTSDSVEGRMVRHQVGQINREKGTVMNPFRFPKKVPVRGWPSILQLMERVLADLRWGLETDVHTRDEREMEVIMKAKRPGDILLEDVEGEITQNRYGTENSLLQDAADAI